MGIFSHHTTEKLTELRDKLTEALVTRHTSPARVSYGAQGQGSRDITYRAEGLADLRKDLEAINSELARREGRSVRGPIYMIGR